MISTRPMCILSTRLSQLYTQLNLQKCPEGKPNAQEAGGRQKLQARRGKVKKQVSGTRRRVKDT